MEIVILNQVQDLYNQGFTQVEIGHQLCHTQTWSRRQLLKLGLDSKNPNRHLITHRFFSPSIRQQSILVGTLMGDGHLQLGGKGRGGARLMFGHGPLQKDYVFWKVNQFGSLFKNKPREREHYYEKRDTTYIAWRCRSRCHHWLTEWHSRFYPEGKKVVTEEILSYIDDLALAVWWCDDGYTPSASRGYPYLGFSLGNLTSSEYELIYAWFSGQDFDPILKPKNKNSIRIKFSSEGSKKLRERIAPFIPESMLYKFNRYLKVN